MQNGFTELASKLSLTIPSKNRKRQAFLKRALLKLAINIPGVPLKRRVKFHRSLAKAETGELYASLSKYLRYVELLESTQSYSRPRKITDLSDLIRSDKQRLKFDEADDTSCCAVARRTATPEMAINSPFPEIQRFSGWPLDMEAANSRADWLDKNRDLVLSDLTDRLASFDTLSLDVFDTFLIRGPEAEATRFLEFSGYLKRELSQGPFAGHLAHVSAESLTLMRAKAMYLTYRFRPRVDGCGEGSIVDVANSIAATLGGGYGLAERLLELEVSFEANKLRRNAVLSNLAAHFKERGGCVILLSDMYLHKEHIEGICKSVDPEGFALVDRVYSSADTVLNKRSGTVFRLVIDEMAIDPGTTVHVGDSFRSDVEMARLAGLNALHFPVSRREIQARQQSLADTVAKFDNIGVCVRDWAKL